MHKKLWWITAALNVALLGTSSSHAQVPGAAATTPAANAATGTAAAAEAKPGFFKKCCTALKECKAKFCKTPAGQMVNSMTVGMSAMTGGIIPSFCPAMPSPSELLKAGVDGAAANAKKDALEAKERVKAVRYLGTLDCRYYPEAEAALIAALRTDRVECVRWEAALAFGSGCCCTKKVIEALEISVSGSEKDGNPAERSERVREAAYFALNHCLSCYRETPKEVDDKDEKEKPPVEKAKDGDGTLPPPKGMKTQRDIIDRARQTVALYGARREGSAPSAMVAKQSVLPKGERSLYHIIRFGADGPSQPTSQPATQQVARQVTQPAPIVMKQPAPTPREMPRVQSSPVERPMLRDNSSATLVAPQEKPVVAVAPAAAVEPMDPTPAPMTINLPPDAAIPSPAAPMTLNIQPAPQATPAAIEKPITDDRSIATLIDSMLTGTTPNDRHTAVRSVVSHDWRKYPQIVAALVKTARLDSDRAVRVNAIRHLASLKMDVPYVFDHLKYMQKDQDEWIRQESTAAIDKLSR